MSDAAKTIVLNERVDSDITNKAVGVARGGAGGVVIQGDVGGVHHRGHIVAIGETGAGDGHACKDVGGGGEGQHIAVDHRAVGCTRAAGGGIGGVINDQVGDAAGGRSTGRENTTHGARANGGGAVGAVAVDEAAQVEVQDVRCIGECNIAFARTGQAEIISAGSARRQNDGLVKADGAVKQVGHLTRAKTGKRSA